jgi:hypothetical protein
MDLIRVIGKLEISERVIGLRKGRMTRPEILRFAQNDRRLIAPLQMKDSKLVTLSRAKGLFEILRCVQE